MAAAMVTSGLVAAPAESAAAVDPATAAREAAQRAAVHRALDALDAQASRMMAVRASVGHAASVLPACAADVAIGDVWRGPAQSALDAGLESLRLLVVCATIAVDDALNDTRRAILMLRARL